MIAITNNDGTGQKLQAFLAGAAATTNPTVTVSFYDIIRQTKTDYSDYPLSNQFTVLAGVTETDICATPSTGTTRHIRRISIYNADTASVTVTVCIDDNGTNRILCKKAIAAGETLNYESGNGWYVL